MYALFMRKCDYNDTHTQIAGEEVAHIFKILGKLAGWQYSHWCCMLADTVNEVLSAEAFIRVCACWRALMEISLTLALNVTICLLHSSLYALIRKSTNQTVMRILKQTKHSEECIMKYLICCSTDFITFLYVSTSFDQ